MRNPPRSALSSSRPAVARADAGISRAARRSAAAPAATATRLERPPPPARIHSDTMAAWCRSAAINFSRPAAAARAASAATGASGTMSTSLAMAATALPATSPARASSTRLVAAVARVRRTLSAARRGLAVFPAAARPTRCGYRTRPPTPARAAAAATLAPTT